MVHKTGMTRPAKTPPKQTQLGWGTLRMVGWATRRWSSFRAYAYQEKGAVCLNEWSAHKLKFQEVTTFPR